LFFKEEMARLQQEIENLKAERVPGRDEKVKTSSCIMIYMWNDFARPTINLVPKQTASLLRLGI
jgi:hypothetical protein